MNSRTSKTASRLPIGGPNAPRDGLRARSRAVTHIIALSIGLLVLSARLEAQAGQTDSDKSHSVINLENAWSQAEKLGDVGALALLLSETFVDIEEDGTSMSREEWLKEVQNNAKNYDSLSNREQTAHVYGNTVVVTGIYLDKIKGQKNIEHRGRFTDTWVFQNSRWQCVASQSTLIKP